MKENFENLNTLIMNNTVEENVFHYLLNLEKENNILNISSMMNYFQDLYPNRFNHEARKLDFYDELTDALALVIKENGIVGLNDNHNLLIKLSAVAKDTKFNINLIKMLTDINRMQVVKRNVQTLKTKQALEKGNLETKSYKYVGRDKRIVYVKSDTNLKELQNYIGKNDFSKDYDYVCMYVENPAELVSENFRYLGIDSLRFALMFRCDNLNQTYTGLNIYFPTKKIDFHATTSRGIKERNALVNLLAAGNCDEKALFTAKYTNLPKPSFQEKQKLVESFAENKKKKEENITDVIIDVCRNSEIQSLIQKINNSKLPRK